MKEIVFVYGLCGIGKTSLLRTFGPRTTPHDLAPRVPKEMVSFAVDQEKGATPAEKAEAIVGKIAAVEAALVAVDIPQMHVKYFKDRTPSPGTRIRHVLLDEDEAVVIQRLRARNPKRDVDKAMKERATLRRVAQVAGWAVMSQVELAEFLGRLAGGCGGHVATNALG